MIDLVLLVADKNAQFALRGGLHRPQALGIRKIEFECIVHPQHDGGVRKTGPEILRLKRRAATHALLLLDYEGSGTPGSAVELEAHLDKRLAEHWGEHAKAIVIEPELDVWMWGSDNALETQLEWDQTLGLRAWLAEQHFAFSDNGKPVRPKEALEAALKPVQLPRSSTLYEQIASKISLQRCHDSSFQRLRTQLTRWFPPIQ